MGRSVARLRRAAGGGETAGLTRWGKAAWDGARVWRESSAQGQKKTKMLERERER